MSTKKKIAPLVLGVLSCVFILFPPILGLSFGLIGLGLSLKAQKEDGLSYKLEIILSSIGASLSLLNIIAGVALLMNMSQ